MKENILQGCHDARMAKLIWKPYGVILFREISLSYIHTDKIVKKKQINTNLIPDNLLIHKLNFSTEK